MKIVIFGLSLSSSWGNGHAVTYRSLIKGLTAARHSVTFFERDVEWYRPHRDFNSTELCDLHFYERLSDLAVSRKLLQSADAILIGTYVPDAHILFRMMRDLNRHILALYDIDTPVTIADLRAGRPNVFDKAMIAGCDLYLSFTGGPILDVLAQEFSAPRVRALYCSVDPDSYKPLPQTRSARRHALSYLGTYSADRQPALDNLLFRTASEKPELSFIVAGAQYPDTVSWPENITHRDHVAPQDHPAFYADSRVTLNLTRRDMMQAGYSPSIRLFEAASCQTAILTDEWPGLTEFFAPGLECLVARDSQDVEAALSLSDHELGMIGQAARERVLNAHTGHQRAHELIDALDDVRHGPRLSSEPNPALHVE